MIVYNETVIIEESAHREWLHWLQQVHIPRVMATGLFQSYQVLTVMDSPNEGVTYCVQYNTDNIGDMNAFYSDHLQQLHQAMHSEFENKFVLFNTLMQTV